MAQQLNTTAMANLTRAPGPTAALVASIPMGRKDPAQLAMGDIRFRQPSPEDRKTAESVTWDPIIRR